MNYSRFSLIFDFVENPAVFDEMLNTVLGLPKKGVSALPQAYPSKREKATPLNPTQITTNGREVGKRLFESGTYKDPRLIYDVSFLSFRYNTSFIHFSLGTKTKRERRRRTS